MFRQMDHPVQIAPQRQRLPAVAPQAFMVDPTCKIRQPAPAPQGAAVHQPVNQPVALFGHMLRHHFTFGPPKLLTMWKQVPYLRKIVNIPAQVQPGANFKHTATSQSVPAPQRIDEAGNLAATFGWVHNLALPWTQRQRDQPTAHLHQRPPRGTDLPLGPAR